MSAGKDTVPSYNWWLATIHCIVVCSFPWLPRHVWRGRKKQLTHYFAILIYFDLFVCLFDSPGVLHADTLGVVVISFSSFWIKKKSVKWFTQSQSTENVFNVVTADMKMNRSDWTYWFLIGFGWRALLSNSSSIKGVRVRKWHRYGFRSFGFFQYNVTQLNRSVRYTVVQID